MDNKQIATELVSVAKELLRIAGKYRIVTYDDNQILKELDKSKKMRPDLSKWYDFMKESIRESLRFSKKYGLEQSIKFAVNSNGRIIVNVTDKNGPVDDGE